MVLAMMMIMPDGKVIVRSLCWRQCDNVYIAMKSY
jgi:hypothetical protein